MTFLRSFTLAVGVVLCVSLAQVQSKSQAQSNSTVRTKQPGAQAQSSSVITDAALTFTTIDVPGATVTSVQGINTAGDMVGIYAQSSVSLPHAFLLSGGNFTLFDYPGENSTVARGINDSGLIVGYAGNLQVLGFLYDGTTFTPIRDGSDSATFTMGIDNAGDVVGGAGTVFGTKGFERRGGQFKTISPPGTYVYVYATGINNFGEVAGWTDKAGFAYNHGKYKTIAFPGANQTEAWGVNDSGVIVGWYTIGGCPFGFALINGQYTSFSYPGAVGTFPRGINASAQIVGEYTFDNQTYHGFVTSPITLTDFQ